MADIKDIKDAKDVKKEPEKEPKAKNPVAGHPDGELNYMYEK
jgi:hypothetical protein